MSGQKFEMLEAIEFSHQDSGNSELKYKKGESGGTT